MSSRSSSRIIGVVAALLLACCLWLAPRPAWAGICSSCECEAEADNDILNFYTKELSEDTWPQIVRDWASQDAWLLYVFHFYLLPSWMDMAQQATTTAMMQTFIFGTFLDAKQQLEVQRTFQILAARAHKDYQPSDDVCMFGTVSRSLGATMFRGEANARNLNAFAQGRLTGAAATSASQGPLSDRLSRLRQLRARYCNIHDNNNALKPLCDSPAEGKNENRDVDYSGVMERSLTLNVDTVDQTPSNHPTDDEQDVWALGSNLYGHDALWRLPEETFNRDAGERALLDIRSIAAERAVAQSSFYTIAGMKAEGTPESGNNFSSEDAANYMNVILKQLGIPTDDSNPETDLFLGDRPSYYAQMEVLTKKIFQDARFYTNLYDTPANVERKRVAMQAIGLIQDFDTLQSNLRTEMILSQTLELELIGLQRQVRNRINSFSSEGVHK